MSHTMDTMYIIIVAIAVLSLGGLAAPLHQFSGQSLLRHSRTDENVEFGPQSLAGRGSGVAVDVADAPQSLLESLSGRVVLLHGAPANGALSVLDQIVGAEPAALIVADKTLEEIAGAAQRLALTKMLVFPVVVASADDKQFLDSVRTLTAPAVQHTEHVLVVGDSKANKNELAPATEASALTATFAPTIKASKTARRVLLTSTFDSLGAVPGRHFADLSGTATAVEVYKHVTSAAASAPIADSTAAVQFLTASHARLNFAGTRLWAASLQQSTPLADMFDLVVSFDSLLASAAEDQRRIYAHVTLPLPEDESPIALFSKAARHELLKAGFELQVVVKKINVSAHDLRFEHEIFAHKRVPAVTFSSLKDPQTDQLLRHSFVTAAVPQAAAVSKARVVARAVSDALLKVFFPAAKKDVQSELESDWEALVKTGLQQANVASLLDPKPAVLKHVERSLRSVKPKSDHYVNRLHMKRLPVPESPVVVSVPRQISVAVFAAKTMTFELGISVVVAGYIALFAVGHFGLRRSLALIAP